MTNSVRTKAIILRRTNYGEADRVLQVITPLGKRSVIAKGVRREKSRLAGGIELFGVSDIVIIKGKSDLGILSSARLVHFYNHIMEEYERMQFAYEAIKQTSKASEMVDEPEWFDVLGEVLAGLDVKTVPLELVQVWFYLRHANLLGHELGLKYDVDGKNLGEDNKYEYDIADKGFRLSEKGSLGADHIKLMRLIATKPIQTLVQIGGINDILGDCLVVARQHSSIY